MGPQRTHPRARAHVRSRYLKGVGPLIGGEIEGASKLTVSNKAETHADRVGVRGEIANVAREPLQTSEHVTCFE